jgi:hypothetical protein
LASQTVPHTAVTFCSDCVKIRPEIWRQQNWLLHEDNAPSHTSIFDQKQHACCPQLPYFSVSLIEDKTESQSFWHNWGDGDRIANGAEHPQEHDFQDTFKKWQKLWERCIHAEGQMTTQVPENMDDSLCILGHDAV